MIVAPGYGAVASVFVRMDIGWRSRVSEAPDRLGTYTKLARQLANLETARRIANRCGSHAQTTLVIPEKQSTEPQ